MYYVKSVRFSKEVSGVLLLQPIPLILANFQAGPFSKQH